MSLAVTHEQTLFSLCGQRLVECRASAYFVIIVVVRTAVNILAADESQAVGGEAEGIAVRIVVLVFFDGRGEVGCADTEHAYMAKLAEVPFNGIIENSLAPLVVGVFLIVVGNVVRLYAGLAFAVIIIFP